MIAENRPGAGGIAGTDAVARSAPDGYTLVLMDPAIVINPTLQPSMPYDLFKQLQTVSVVSSSPEVLVVAPQLPVKTLAELVAYGKANPGQAEFRLGRHRNHAASRRRTVQAAHRHRGHPCALSQHRRSRIPDMMANKVQFAFSSIAGALPFTKDNRVRARHHRRQAVAGLSGPADGGRRRPQGL